MALFPGAPVWDLENSIIYHDIEMSLMGVGARLQAACAWLPVPGCLCLAACAWLPVPGCLCLAACAWFLVPGCLPAGLRARRRLLWAPWRCWHLRRSVDAAPPATGAHCRPPDCPTDRSAPTSRSTSRPPPHTHTPRPHTPTHPPPPHTPPPTHPPTPPRRPPQVSMADLVTKKGMELIISEWGFGGGNVDGVTVSPDVEYLVLHPFFGFWGQAGANNPWANPEYQAIRCVLAPPAGRVCKPGGLAAACGRCSSQAAPAPGAAPPRARQCSGCMIGGRQQRAWRARLFPRQRSGPGAAPVTRAACRGSPAVQGGDLHQGRRLAQAAGRPHLPRQRPLQLGRRQLGRAGRQVGTGGHARAGQSCGFRSPTGRAAVGCLVLTLTPPCPSTSNPRRYDSTSWYNKAVADVILNHNNYVNA
jgi:hypothetical protein